MAIFALKLAWKVRRSFLIVQKIKGY